MSVRSIKILYLIILLLVISVRADSKEIENGNIPLIQQVQQVGVEDEMSQQQQTLQKGQFANMLNKNQEQSAKETVTVDQPSLDIDENIQQSIEKQIVTDNNLPVIQQQPNRSKMIEKQQKDESNNKDFKRQKQQIAQVIIENHSVEISDANKNEQDQNQNDKKQQSASKAQQQIEQNNQQVQSNTVEKQNQVKQIQTNVLKTQTDAELIQHNINNINTVSNQGNDELTMKVIDNTDSESKFVITNQIPFQKGNSKLEIRDKIFSVNQIQDYSIVKSEQLYPQNKFDTQQTKDAKKFIQNIKKERKTIKKTSGKAKQQPILIKNKEEVKGILGNVAAVSDKSKKQIEIEINHQRGVQAMTKIQNKAIADANSAKQKELTDINLQLIPAANYKIAATNSKSAFKSTNDNNNLLISKPAINKIQNEQHLIKENSINQAKEIPKKSETNKLGLKKQALQIQLNSQIQKSKLHDIKSAVSVKTTNNLEANQNLVKPTKSVVASNLKLLGQVDKQNQNIQFNNLEQKPDKYSISNPTILYEERQRLLSKKVNDKMRKKNIKNQPSINLQNKGNLAHTGQKLQLQKTSPQLDNSQTESAKLILTQNIKQQFNNQNQEIQILKQQLKDLQLRMNEKAIKQQNQQQQNIKIQQQKQKPKIQTKQFQERKQQQKKEQTKKEKEKMQQQKKEQQKIQQQKQQQEKIQQEKNEQKRIQQQKQEQQRIQQQKQLKEKIQQQQKEQQRLQQEKIQKEKKEQEIKQQEKMQKEKKEQQKMQQEKIQQKNKAKFQKQKEAILQKEALKDEQQKLKKQTERLKKEKEAEQAQDRKAAQSNELVSQKQNIKQVGLSKSENVKNSITIEQKQSKLIDLSENKKVDKTQNQNQPLKSNLANNQLTNKQAQNKKVSMNQQKGNENQVKSQSDLIRDKYEQQLLNSLKNIMTDEEIKKVQQGDKKERFRIMLQKINQIKTQNQNKKISNSNNQKSQIEDNQQNSKQKEQSKKQTAQAPSNQNNKFNLQIQKQIPDQPKQQIGVVIKEVKVSSQKQQKQQKQTSKPLTQQEKRLQKLLQQQTKAKQLIQKQKLLRLKNNQKLNKNQPVPIDGYQANFDNQIDLSNDEQSDNFFTNNNKKKSREEIKNKINQQQIKISKLKQSQKNIQKERKSDQDSSAQYKKKIKKQENSQDDSFKNLKPKKISKASKIKINQIKKKITANASKTQQKQNKIIEKINSTATTQNITANPSIQTIKASTDNTKWLFIIPSLIFGLCYIQYERKRKNQLTPNHEYEYVQDISLPSFETDELLSS